MKKKLHLLKKYLMLSAASLLLTVNVAFAQDEVIVEPGYNTVLDALTENPGATLILKKGGKYVNNQTVEITVPTIIKSEEGTEDVAPPVLSVFANPGEAGDKYVFTISADVTFEDLGILGFTLDPGNEMIMGFILVTEPDLNIVVDGCVFQGGLRWNMWTNGKKNLDITYKNNIFFNLSYIGWDNYGGYMALWGGDSIQYKAHNNTYFVGGRIFGNGGSGPNGGQFMDHNSYINTWGDTFFPVTDKDFELKNSIFFNSNIRGYVGFRYAENGVDTLTVGDHLDWKADTLSGDFAIHPHLNDTVGDPRNVTVTNNLKIYEQRVLDFYEDNNVTQQTFFNVTGMEYAEEYGWDIRDNILQEDGNVVDPQFEMGAIPEGAFEMIFKQRQERHLPADMQGDEFPYELAWRPGGEARGEFIWPLPFNFKPTNEDVWHAGDDGYPLGDLNWFGPEVVADWEASVENTLGIRRNISIDMNLINYPNPFSSTTQIRYNLPESSHVILKVYSITGAEVATIVNESQIAGQHEVTFDGAELPGGSYFCKVMTDSSLQVHKMTLIK